jgi:hypothetical protein
MIYIFVPELHYSTGISIILGESNPKFSHSKNKDGLLVLAEGSGYCFHFAVEVLNMYIPPRFFLCPLVFSICEPPGFHITATGRRSKWVTRG